MFSRINEYISVEATPLMTIALFATIALALAYVINRLLQSALTYLIVRQQRNIDAGVENVGEMRRSRRWETRLLLLRTTLPLITYALVALFIVANSFPDRQTSIIGASLLIAIIGFAAQSLLRDIIYGATMRAEHWFEIGDAVTIEPWNMSGIVEQISLRSTRLRGLNGEAVWIHNSFMYGARVARTGIRDMALEVITKDAEGACALIENVARILPQGAVYLVRPLTITNVEHISGDISRVWANASAPPGREWILEKSAVELLRELDVDKIIIGDARIYNADAVGEKRMERSVRPFFDG